MREIWTKKWKKILIWLSGYINFIAYAVVGGYVIVKEKDEDLRKTAKIAFVVTLIFTAISAVLSIYNYCGGFSSSYYSSSAYDVYKIFTNIVGIAKIVVFAIFILMTLFEKEEVKIESAPQDDEE